MNSPDLEPISAAFQASDWTQAEAHARAQLAGFPDDTDLLASLAISLQLQGRALEARDVHARLTELAPEDDTHWANFGTALRDTGALNEAAAAYARALSIAPSDAGHHLNQSMLLMQQQDFAGARDAALTAHELDPGEMRITIHAARACQACHETEQAESLLKHWQHWLPIEDVGLQQELAELLLAGGDGPAALWLLEDAVSRSPGDALPLVRLASACERLNRLSDAERALARIAAMPIAARDLVREELARVVARIAHRNSDLDVAGSILEQTGPRGEGDYAHFFAVAAIHDKQGDTARTMQALERAHALQVDGLRRLVPERFEPGAAPLPAARKRMDAANLARWQPVTSPTSAQSPVFIVGFPRSGTTLLEQMLDAHPGLQSMDENPFFNNLAEQLSEQNLHVPDDIPRLGQADCDELRRRYLEMVCSTVARRWDAQLVDKNPLNLLWLPLMHRLFPNAKFILALRHPCDVILSCYMQNFRANVLAAACASLERLAHAYVESMQCWLHHEALLKPDVLIVRYEEIVGDIAAQADRIAHFLALEDPSPLLRFDEHARSKGFIATPSYTQVIQPVNRNALGRWVRYREYLEPVLPILEPMLEHWNYATQSDPASS